jgi:hypothetical protein
LSAKSQRASQYEKYCKNIKTTKKSSKTGQNEQKPQILVDPSGGWDAEDFDDEADLGRN